MQKLRGVNTVEKVFESETPSLASISRHCGTGKAKAWVEAWILELLDFINVKQSMGVAQISLTADFILERYACLTVADIQLVFKRAMAGDYGPFYGKLDGSMILGWLRTYFDQRCDAAEAISIQESQSHKAEKQIIPIIAPEIAGIYQAEAPRKLTEKQKQRKAREVYAAYLMEKNRREYNNATNQQQTFEP